MKLTAGQMETIVVEVATGKEPSLHTPEAEEFRKIITKEIEEIRAAGGSLAIPSEWHV